MATAAARSPSPGQARPCCAMRRSADSSPFKPADCPQRSASSFSKGGGVCGCHASPRRRSFGEKENEQRDAARTPAKAARASGSKNFMSPTISATSKAVVASASPRKRVLGERNEEPHHFAPFSSANLAHKPKGPSEVGSARRVRLSFDGPAPAPPAAAPAPEAASHGSRRSFGEEDARMENHHHAAADSVDAEPSRAALYDPKTNYTSPRPQFLLYEPNPRIEMYRHGGCGARRLEEGLASESSEESATTTTDDDLTEEEQEQAPQKLEEPSALAAPYEAAVPAAASRVLPPEPALGSPRAPVLTSDPAVMSPPARVLATQPMATSPRTPVLTLEPAVTSPPARVLATEPRSTSPRTRALTPEPELGVSSARAPVKKRSPLRFLFPVALILFVAAAFVYVPPPDSPIMSNTALSKVSNFLSVQELHPVELAAWLKQWSSSSLNSITSYWEAFASTQEQEYFGPQSAANLSAASADADHGADFYYNFAEAWSVPSEEPIGASFLEEQFNIQDVASASNTDLSAHAESDVVVEEESIDAAVAEESDASDSYSVAEELPIGASFLEEQFNIQDVASASNTDLSAHAESDVVVEEESIDAAVAEESDASDSYSVAEELDLEISEEAPDNYGEEEMTSFSQNLDTPSDASDSYKVAEELDLEMSEEAPDNYGEEEMTSFNQNLDTPSDASDSHKVAEELDLEMSEEAPDNYGEEEMTSFSQNLDIPSEPTGEPEQDVESDESEDDHTSGKEGQEAYSGLKSDSSMLPSYLDKISKPAAAAGVALLVVLLSAGIAVLSMRKKQAQVVTNASASAEEPEQAENQSVEGHHLVKPSQSVSGSSEGHRLAKPSQFQSSVAEETERFGDSAFSQYSSSLSSGQGRRRKAKEEEILGLEPTSRRESTAQSTSSYGSFTTFEKISAKKKNKDDEAMTPVRRSSRLRTVKSPEA